MRAPRALLAAAVSAMLCVSAATAQDLSVPAAERQRVWYAETLENLARTLGGAHSIRLSCSQTDYTLYRFMERMIALEAPNQRTMLEGAWNEGFRRERALHPSCNQEALRAEAELRARGGRLADGLAAVHIVPPPP